VQYAFHVPGHPSSFKHRTGSTYFIIHCFVVSLLHPHPGPVLVGSETCVISIV